MGVEIPGMDEPHKEEADEWNLDAELFQLEDEAAENVEFNLHLMASLAIASLYVGQITHRKSLPQEGIRISFTAMEPIEEGQDGVVSFTMAETAQLLMNGAKSIGKYLADLGHPVEVVATFERINQMQQRGEIK